MPNHHHDQNGQVYTCPMHPEVREARAGMCPICGMSLVKHDKPSSAKATEGRHAGHPPAPRLRRAGSLAMFKRKFWISLILTIPVVVARFIELPGGIYLSAIFGSVVFFYGGWVFLAGAVREIRGRAPGMMTLIGMAISVAYLYSLAVVFGFPGEPLFWELTTLITVMLLGHYLEMRSVQSARGALQELSKLLPDTAEVISTPSSSPSPRSRFGEAGPYQGGESLPAEARTKAGEGVKTVPISELRVGDMILVRPGGKIAADGEIQEGESEVNESMATGESRPVSKKSGDKVIAGTINGSGSLKIKVTKIGEDTFLAGVMRLVKEAEASKSRLQLLADKAAFLLTIIAVSAGVLTFILWLLAKASPGFALERLVAVLVIACPHALGLAIPLVASISTTMAARNGLLVRQRLALEQARKIDVILFDKTGTLTKGEHVVTEISNFSAQGGSASGGQFPISKDEVLRLTAALESHSEHIIGKAVVKKAQAEGLKIPEVKEFKALPGRGVQGIVEGKKVMAGGPQLLEELGIRNQELGGEDKTIVYVVVENNLIGSIALADEVREESKQAVKEIQDMGIRVAMITGDSEAVAKSVAGELGIEHYRAEVLPEEKVNIVKEFQTSPPRLRRGFGGQATPLRYRRGKGEVTRVAFVGDGINDAPALAQADLGIAIGAGTNVAIESAGIILVKSDPRDVVKIMKLSKLTYSKMIQNLFWATGYNVVALPLAAGVLANQGVVLEPAVGALLMSLSTVIVAVNALLLRKKQL